VGDEVGEHVAAAAPTPSRTSQVIALSRCGLVRPHSPDGDPEAQQHLCTGMRPLPDGWARPDLAARTQFFDQQLLDAISGGVRQIVILGAGYDDRALRFRSPGVRFFEVDHPETQHDKAQRLEAFQAGDEELTLAPADFRHDDVDAVLASCGHDAASSSLFICEGVLVYLDQPTIIGLLAALRSRAEADSTLAASLATHRAGLDSEQVTLTANLRRPTSTTEPWRTILPRGEHLALVNQAGWQIGHAVDAAELDADVAPGRSLFVTARPAPA